MKTALALVCSLSILWTLFVQTGTAGASGVSPAPSCCQCQASCCSANLPRPEPQPVSTAPAFSFHNQLLAAAAAVLLWIQPTTVANHFLSFSSPQFLTSAAPLYDWNCALLI